MLIRKFHAPTIYAFSLLIFGMSAILLAYANSYAAVLILRLVIGLGEASVMTSFMYTSLWYRREEMSVRAGERNLLTAVNLVLNVSHNRLHLCNGSCSWRYHWIDVVRH